MNMEDGAPGARELLTTNFAEFAECVEDPAEETFWLFSQNRHQHDLGMVDPKAAEITVTVADKEYTISQSPGLLNSTLSGGTTGAAVWRTTHLLAEWFATPDNAFFRSGLLHAASSIIELGAGVAGLLPMVLAPRIGYYLATDQPYALRLLQENFSANRYATRTKAKVARPFGSVQFAPLDWETDDLKHFLTTHSMKYGVDMIIASDCVYNYHLVKPLVDTCAHICRARAASATPTICLIAQQIREPDVFDEWLTAFSQQFHTWRLNDDTLLSSLRVEAGYVVHIGIVRADTAD